MRRSFIKASGATSALIGTTVAASYGTTSSAVSSNRWLCRTIARKRAGNAISVWTCTNTRSFSRSQNPKARPITCVCT
ncbi:twin-arginine translocation signal domain-containing protein [Pseudomonas fragi]|nr:twin-arginine translocation signal domain-containing protein [Pseudomonas fragi]MBM1204883.1 twin-arginine translocation signal domain-containing protein [Pseudomonas fragi]NMY57963.1 twin-arginine translocation signal domain-containing protein [Pseudomonas sp. WS 5051]